MIFFACKQCGKTYERPEAASGSLVFCACGQANRVPWESTAPASAAPAPASETHWEAGEEPVLTAAPKPAREEGRRPGRARHRDPAYCLNHEETPSTQKCADCGEAFCDGCVVTWQGQTLCGPCKNLRARAMQRSARVSVAAIFSLVAALVSGPVALVILLIGVGAQAPLIGLFGVVPQLVALVLGAVGLRQIETNPRMSGRSVAITGIVTSLVGVVLSVALSLVLQKNLG